MQDNSPEKWEKNIFRKIDKDFLDKILEYINNDLVIDFKAFDYDKEINFNDEGDIHQLKKATLEFIVDHRDKLLDFYNI